MPDNMDPATDLQVGTGDPTQDSIRMYIRNETA